MDLKSKFCRRPLDEELFYSDLEEETDKERRGSEERTGEEHRRREGTPGTGITRKEEMAYDYRPESVPLPQVGPQGQQRLAFNGQDEDEDSVEDQFPNQMTVGNKKCKIYPKNSSYAIIRFGKGFRDKALTLPEVIYLRDKPLTGHEMMDQIPWGSDGYFNAKRMIKCPLGVNWLATMAWLEDRKPFCSNSAHNDPKAWSALLDKYKALLEVDISMRRPFSEASLEDTDEQYEQYSDFDLPPIHIKGSRASAVPGEEIKRYFESTPVLANPWQRQLRSLIETASVATDKVTAQVQGKSAFHPNGKGEERGSAVDTPGHLDSASLPDVEAEKIAPIVEGCFNRAIAGIRSYPYDAVIRTQLIDVLKKCYTEALRDEIRTSPSFPSKHEKNHGFKAAVDKFDHLLQDKVGQLGTSVGKKVVQSNARHESSQTHATGDILFLSFHLD